MSFWTTPSGAGFRTLDFLVRRLPPVRRLRMELDAAVEYHDYYVTTIDRALGQPRGNGDIRSAHMIEIARLKECQRAKACQTCGDGPDGGPCPPDCLPTYKHWIPQANAEREVRT